GPGHPGWLLAVRERWTTGIVTATRNKSSRTLIRRIMVPAFCIGPTLADRDHPATQLSGTPPPAAPGFLVVSLGAVMLRHCVASSQQNRNLVTKMRHSVIEMVRGRSHGGARPARHGLGRHPGATLAAASRRTRWSGDQAGPGEGGRGGPPLDS